MLSFWPANIWLPWKMNLLHRVPLLLYTSCNNTWILFEFHPSSSQVALNTTQLDYYKPFIVQYHTRTRTTHIMHLWPFHALKSLVAIVYIYKRNEYCTMSSITHLIIIIVQINLMIMSTCTYIWSCANAEGWNYAQLTLLKMECHFTSLNITPWGVAFKAVK